MDKETMFCASCFQIWEEMQADKHSMSSYTHRCPRCAASGRPLEEVEKNLGNV